MIYKILLPAIVIGIIYLLGRSHGQEEESGVKAVARQSTPIKKRSHTPILLAVLALSTFMTGLFIYRNWADNQKEVVIRVIHIETGRTITYQAHKGDVHGRTFTALDGRRVRLADAERMEIVEDKDN
ncbi:MAG: hypothetical protein HQL54_01940 [Magnetococcales bacterium]|nr:hypothetical protein [Magnetococcales bacterium]